MMCSTKPLLIHWVRGVVGMVFLITAFSLAGSHPVVALLLGGGALVAFRGCPTCWLAGLFEVARADKPEPPAAVPRPPRGVTHCCQDLYCWQELSG